MKHSYTHADKTFSVIALADGSVLEIRRGDRTFRPKDRSRGRWTSLDDWRATWPADASPSAPRTMSASKTIIDRVFADRHTNLKLGLPSAGSRRRLKKDIDFAEYQLSHYYNIPSTCTYHIAARKQCQERLLTYKKLLRDINTIPFQTAIDTAHFGRAYKYVSHNGRMLPVYINREESVVLIRDYCPTEKKGVKVYTPEDLGITADSAFYQQDTYTQVFIPA